MCDCTAILIDNCAEFDNSFEKKKKKTLKKREFGSFITGLGDETAKFVQKYSLLNDCIRNRFDFCSDLLLLIM